MKVTSELRAAVKVVVEAHNARVEEQREAAWNVAREGLARHAGWRRVLHEWQGLRAEQEKLETRLKECGLGVARSGESLLVLNLNLALDKAQIGKVPLGCKRSVEAELERLLSVAPEDGVRILKELGVDWSGVGRKGKARAEAQRAQGPSSSRNAGLRRGDSASATESEGKR